MVAMKQFVHIILICAGAVFSAGAATFDNCEKDGLRSDSTYVALVRRMDTEIARRDSLAQEISAMRTRYAERESERESLGARIVALEGESYVAKSRCDKAAAALAEYERKWLTENFGKTASDGTVDTTSADVGESSAPCVPVRKVANLVYNDVFARELSASDCRTLREAQDREADAADAVGEYRNAYASMIAVQREYMEAETESAADSIMRRFSLVQQAAELAERAVERNWAAVYDNKTYLYNLLMEKCGRSDILAEAERKTDEIAQNIADGAGTYASDAVANYYYQKRGLLDYEIAIASAFDLVSAKDSLARVATGLKNIDYRAGKITLEKRYFIEYEPLKVIRPTIYNAQNPIPKTKIYEHGTIYRIRIGIFTNRPNLSALRGITPLSHTDAYNNGRHAYFVGGFRTEQEANEGVAYLKRLGFRDPKVVVWVDGEYITDLAKWAAENTGEYNIEISGVATLSEQVRAIAVARNADCEFSRVGNKFVIGKFADKSVADEVAASVEKTDGQPTVAVVKVKKP